MATQQKLDVELSGGGCSCAKLETLIHKVGVATLRDRFKQGLSNTGQIPELETGQHLIELIDWHLERLANGPRSHREYHTYCCRQCENRARLLKKQAPDTNVCSAKTEQLE